jgi:hypothetical protein
VKHHLAPPLSKHTPKALIVRAKHYIDNKIIAIPAQRLYSQREATSKWEKKHKKKRKREGLNPFSAFPTPNKDNP